MARKKAKRTYKNGSIVQLPSGRWRIRWREGRRRFSATYDEHDVALRALQRAVAHADTTRAGDKPDPRMTPKLGVLGPEWLAGREKLRDDHRNWRTDKSRWKLHIAPLVADMRPDEVDKGTLRDLIKAVRDKGLSAATAGHCIRLLSSLFSDLVEEGRASVNPWTALPRKSKTRRLTQSTHDPALVPFVKRAEDIRRIYLALAPRQIPVGFMIGARAGLRTSEIQALPWTHVDLERARIHVQLQVSDTGRLKGGRSRMVTIWPDLLIVLKAWKLASGGEGLVVPPTRKRSRFGPSKYIRKHTLAHKIRAALTTVKLPDMTWYQATRHTFASHWVLDGGDMKRLSVEMGHSTQAVTERHYAHLRGSTWHPDTAPKTMIDVSPATGELVTLKSGAIGPLVGHGPKNGGLASVKKANG